MRRTCAFASPGFARKSQGQASRALERAGKETRPANMKDHLFAAPLCKSCNPLGPLRNPLPQTFPMGEFAERWAFSKRCIGFSSTAVRPVYWYGCSTHFTRYTTRLPHTQLACGISTCLLIVPRNVDGQDFLPAQCNALGHSPNTHVPLYFALCYHRLYLSPATASALLLDTSLSDWACSPMPTK
jgi:hypothetical protein